MSAQKKQINLLSREGFENTTAGKILNWTLSVGRAIVVITELIVIVAFLSRFWLDRQLTNLNDANAAKKNQIQASLNFEKEFRNVQERLQALRKVSNNQAQMAATIQAISHNTPRTIQAEKIEITEKTILVSGKASSNKGLAQFINALETDALFEDVNLKDVSPASNNSNILAFSITGKIVNKNKNQ